MLQNLSINNHHNNNSLLIWLAGVQKLKRIIRNTDKGRCPLWTGEDDVTHVTELFWSYKWWMKFLNEKWLHMNKGVAYRKILRCNNKSQIRNLGRHNQIHVSVHASLPQPIIKQYIYLMRCFVLLKCYQKVISHSNYTFFLQTFLISA